MLLGRRWFTAHWLAVAKLVDEPAAFAPAMRSALARLATDARALSPAAASFLLAATTMSPEQRPNAERLSRHAFVADLPRRVRMPAVPPPAVFGEPRDETPTLEVELPAGIAMTDRGRGLPHVQAVTASVTPTVTSSTIAPAPPAGQASSGAETPHEA